MVRPRKENPIRNREWKDNTRNERTRNREQALTDKLVAAGWKNKSAFLTAIINGEIEVPRKLTELGTAPQPAQKVSK